MKSSLMLLPVALLLACNLPPGAEAVMASGQCHDVDMYGIYKVCDPPPSERRHDERPRTFFQTEIVSIPQPIAAPPSDTLRRELTMVDAKLHALHLFLNDRQARGEIEANFFDEEMRYLAQIEDHEKSAADVNGGYLTEAQESALLQQLQDVEREINSTVSNNG